MNEQNIKITVAYDGNNYVGWQHQDGLPSVQRTLQDAFEKVLKIKAPYLRCAGRTDAGVHAAGQVFNIKLKNPVDAYRLGPALNHFLPSDIGIRQCEEVHSEFDARQDSHSKVYRYYIDQGSMRHPRFRGTHWHVKPKLDIKAMQKGASFLIGEHDFESFRSAQCDADHAIRNIFSIDIQHRQEYGDLSEIWISIWGNAFCRHMCRILSGTLVDIGRKKTSPENMQDILNAKKRTAAGETAPGYGLSLLKVYYEAPASTPQYS